AAGWFWSAGPYIVEARTRCDPGLIRTGDLRFRKPPLYPPELRGLGNRSFSIRASPRETSRNLAPPGWSVNQMQLSIERPLRWIYERTSLLDGLMPLPPK